MSFSSTRTVVVLAFLLHSFLAFSQNPDCLKNTFFKSFGADNNTEFGSVIARSADSSLYIAGRTGSKTFIQKTNYAGEAIWFREFVINPFEPVNPVQIFEDADGMIVGCGTQEQFAGAKRGFVFRYDPVAGNLLWAHPISSNNPLAAGIFEKTPGGDFVYYQNQTNTGVETDIEILNLERLTGNIIPSFATRYEYLGFNALSKMVTVNGSLYGLGWATGREASLSGSRRAMLARFDPVNGMPLWAQLGPVDTSVLVDYYGSDLIADGDSLVAVFQSDENQVNAFSPDSVYIQKTDLDGHVIWLRKLNLDFAPANLGIISVTDGYILSGWYQFGKAFILKINKNGEAVWGKTLVYGPNSIPNISSIGRYLTVNVADTLFYTGIARTPAVGTGISDVLLWKMLSDGTMEDSCGYVSNFQFESIEILNPVITPIDLHQLISTAVATNSTVPWTSNSLEEHLICPDCSIPNPCPQGNDFVVDINDIKCSGGFVNMTFSLCELAGGVLPALSVTFYDANPFSEPADKLGTYQYNASTSDSCVTLQMVNVASQLGAASTQNGFQIFAVVNDLGNTNTPFDPADFPLSNLEECDYSNNLDSIRVELPMFPTLDLGADLSICSNETVNLNAGPGFSKYQWSNGSTTQSTIVSAAGQYRITVTDACGFKQLDTINLQVRQQSLVAASGAFCPGKSVTLHGYTFNQVGTYQETINGINGDCDTAITFFITKLPYEERVQLIYFCPFQTVTINGITYEDSGLVRDTVSSNVTCDTIVFYFLNQLPLPFRNFNYQICPGDSVVFNGHPYFQPTSFTDTLYNAGFGCDTVAYVTIDFLPHEELNRTIQFCPGSSVVINGHIYTQPGLAFGSIPSIGGGCDTLVNYTLEWLPSPTRSQTVSFCPGNSVTIAGNVYTQPGIVLATIPGAASECDTVVTYTLQFAPLPTRAETLQFCQGESITLGGQTYTQPATVILTEPGAGNDCDTLVTYTLQFITPGPSTMSLTCPPVLNVATVPGTGATPVIYDLPVPSSTCECAGNTLTLTNGLASGSSFPVGTTQVCYAAKDKCGSSATCCFTITVREELACDTKTIGCIKYELLGITTDPSKRYTYRVRVTNNCASKLIYTAIQLPDGLTAVDPLNNSTYTTSEGRKYTIRNPNYSPFYSIRFKATNDSIANGQSDVFEYTLPAQANPTFIHITSRLATQSFYEAHMNVFNCPIGVTMSQNRTEDLIRFDPSSSGILLFPNPTSGELYADLSRWQGEGLNMHILDSRGVLVQSLQMKAETEAQQIPLASQLPTGLYFLEIRTDGGEKEVLRFMLER